MTSNVMNNKGSESKEILKVNSNRVEYRKLQLAVVFSSLIEEKIPSDIYDGTELTPFEMRDSLFKSIMRKEFSEAIKEFNKKLFKLE